MKAKEIVNKIKDNEYILLKPRVILIDNQYISISNKIEINKESKNDLLNYLLDRIGLSNEAYKSIPISSIVFSNGIRKGKISPHSNGGIILGNFNEVKNITYHTYYNNKLPITTKPKEYG